MVEQHASEGLYRNTVSYIGALLVLLSGSLILIAMLADISIGHASPYIGIFTYLIFPSMAAFGLMLVLYGMRREAKRRLREGTANALPYPRLDLNDPLQRRRFSIVVVGGSLLGTLMVWGGYNGFLFTESVTFCGQVCHSVMKPEHTAYLTSPHARVSCVDCHVGSGATWYVRSKLSGARQLFATAFRTYERPIATPVKGLRPARETCEQCHWPQKFFGAKLLQLPHFRYDENNTAEQITLILKTGGGGTVGGQNAGIHWHMIVANKITFAASDAKLQDIPWVQVKRADGSTADYIATDSKLSTSELSQLPKRAMDCMDCHNRPTHAFPSPDGAVDQAMLSGAIGPSLPWIKKVAVEALIQEYPNQQEAHSAIDRLVRAFYSEKYPTLSDSRSADIKNAISALHAIYDRSVFPEMKVNFRTYPNNIGHRNWPGCFRCHDDKHQSTDGKVLSMACNLCHSFPQRGPVGALGEVPTPTLAWHPWDMPVKHLNVPAHDRVLCSKCHEAGFLPRKQCGDCHR
jgi:hypothetical protein